MTIQILEIWANDAGTEYAAKISGHRFFLKATDPEAKYTRIIYAAPYLEGHIEDLKDQLESLIDQESRHQQGDGDCDDGARSPASRRADWT